jgi:hypothetical protein
VTRDDFKTAGPLRPLAALFRVLHPVSSSRRRGKWSLFSSHLPRVPNPQEYNPSRPDSFHTLQARSGHLSPDSLLSTP